jgi:hypothetical protein
MISGMYIDENRSTDSGVAPQLVAFEPSKKITLISGFDVIFFVTLLLGFI